MSCGAVERIFSAFVGEADSFLERLLAPAGLFKARRAVHAGP